MLIQCQTLDDFNSLASVYGVPDGVVFTTAAIISGHSGSARVLGRNGSLAIQLNVTNLGFGVPTATDITAVYSAAVQLATDFSVTG